MAIDYQKIKNWKFEDQVQKYTERDSMLYALGLGRPVLRSRLVLDRRGHTEGGPVAHVLHGINGPPDEPPGRDLPRMPPI